MLFSWVQFASAVISRVKLYLEAIVCFIFVCFCCRARGLVAGGEGDGGRLFRLFSSGAFRLDGWGCRSPMRVRLADCFTKLFRVGQNCSISIVCAFRTFTPVCCCICARKGFLPSLLQCVRLRLHRVVSECLRRLQLTFSRGIRNKEEPLIEDLEDRQLAYCIRSLERNEHCRA